MKPTTEQAEAGAMLDQYIGMSFRLEMAKMSGDEAIVDSILESLLDIWRKLGTQQRYALETVFIPALTRKGGEADHDRARATSRRIGAAENLMKAGWKWDGCVWFAPKPLAQPDQAELVTYWIGRHGDLKRLVEKILQPPGGDSFSGWSAWLIDHSRMFDPYIQAPYAKLLADWLASLDVIAAAPRPVGGDGESTNEELK